MPPLRLFFSLAHPDDESMGTGACAAKYAAEGVETYLLCATRGERGWQGEPSANPGLTELGRIRTTELMNAAKVLGLREVNFLDYLDGDLDQAPPAEIIKKIVTQLRRVQPQVVVTFPPDGSYGHPDHIAISQFTTAACVAAADAAYVDLLQQPSHRVSKLYFMIETRHSLERFKKHGLELTIGVDGVERKHEGWEEWMMTTRLEVAPYWQVAYEAVKCHASQLVSWGEMFNAWTPEQHREIWQLGTFYRAYSLVNGGRKIETDLFEGLR